MTANDDHDSQMGQLAAEWRERLRRGERPEVAEYVERFPALADAIRELFPAVVLMEELKPGANDVTGAAGLLTGDVLTPAAGPRLERLGDFRILREVGRGGMGVVYEAEQESLGRRVALKVLPAQALVDAQQRKRFLREAKAAARMHHTNIVPVYGVGEHDGISYYVMQFIHGQGLDVVLAELMRQRQARSPAPTVPHPAGDVSAADVARSLLTGRFDAAAPLPSADNSGTVSLSSAVAVLPGQPAQTALSESGRHYWDSVARIGIQVADALDYAAGQGILHRDVKPSNLLLDTHGTVWVTDFGLAKVMVDADNLTHTGEIVGTLRYMPPERFEGRSDVRGDIYSLGLTLYELLALHPAYEESNRHSLIQQVMQRDPPPPSRYNPQVPRDLETIVLKAIARDPAHRYQSPGELAADLKRFVEDKPILARRVSLRERLWRWCRRNPALAASTGLAAAALLAVTIVSAAFALAQARSNAALERAFEGLTAEQQRTRQEQEKTKEALAHSQELAKGLAAEQKKTKGALARSQELAGNLAVEQEKTKGALTRSQELAKTLEAEQDRTRRALAKSQGVLARLQLERGQALVRQHAPQLGALWLARALQTAPGDADLQELARTNLDALRGELPVLRAVLVDRQLNGTLDVSPDSKLVGSGSLGRAARLWHAADGTPAGELPHADAVPAFAFSPDGKTALTGSRDRTAQRWDLATRKPLGPPLRHPAGVYLVRFSPDGKTALTACLDRKVRLWDVASGKPVGAPMANDGNPQALFSPDGKIILTGFPGRVVRLFDAATGKPLGRPLLHPNTAYRALFSPDGKTVLTACLDRNARLWDVATRKLIGKPMEHSEPIGPVAFRPDGKAFATGSQSGTVRLWDVATGKPFGAPLRHTAIVMTVAFSPDGRTVLTAGGDYTARLWDADTGRPVGEPLVHPAPVAAARFTPDGRSLLSLATDRTVRLWELPAGRLVRAPLAHRDPVWAVAVSPDGKTLATASGDFVRYHRGEAQLWDAATGRPLGPPLLHGNKVEAVLFSPDGKTVLTASLDMTFRLWDAATGRPRGDPLRHTTSIWRAAFSPDGKTVAVSGADGTVRLWDVPSQHTIGPALKNGTSLVVLAFSPDGKLLATGGRDSTARLWDAATGKPVRILRGHLGFVNAVAFSPDGTTLLTGSSDRTARLWDVASGRSRALQHQAVVSFVAFRPDGKVLLTAGERLVRLWDTATGGSVGPPLQHQEIVAAVAFSPDGKTVLTGCRDGKAYLWHARTGQALGPPFVNQGAVHAVAFSPDGRTALTAGDDRTARLWVVPAPVSGKAERLLRWVEVRSGMEMTPEGPTRLLDPAAWLLRRQALTKLGGPPDRADGATKSAPGWHRRWAAEAAATGHWFAARWHLDRVLAARPDDWFAHARRSTAWLRLGHEDRAAADCAAALKLGPPDTVRDWFGRQSPEFDAGTSWPTAVWYLDQLLKARPDDGQAHALRVKAYRQLGEDRKAAADFDLALKRGPRADVLALFRSFCVECETRGQWRAELWYLERLVRADAKNWEWHGLSGHAYAQLGQFDQASESYGRATEGSSVRGRLVSHWGARAALQLHLGDLEGYRATCARMLRTVKNRTSSARNRMAWIGVLAPGTPATTTQVVTMAQQVVTAVTRPPAAGQRRTPQAFALANTVHTTFGAALYRAGRYREAVERLNESLKTFGTEGKVTDWIFLAMAHHRLGNKAEARKWLDKVVAWFDDATPERPRDAALGMPVPWATWLAARLLRYEAEALVRGTPDTKDTDERIAYARAHARLGQWDRAAADFEKARAARPTDTRLEAELGACLFHLGQWAKALPGLEKGVELHPAEALAWAWRGRCRLELKQADKAVADFTRAVELRRVAFDKEPTLLTAREALGEAYLELAEGQRALGHSADAAATLLLVRKLWPGHGTHLYEAARQTARCVPASGKGRIADLAMATLAEAVLAGYASAAALQADRHLDALRAREDFRALLAAMGTETLLPRPTGEVGQLRGHAPSLAVMAVAVSPDGRRALTGGLDKTVRLWDLATGKELRRLTKLATSIHGIAFSPDGRTALVAGGPSYLCLWDLETGEEVRRFKGHTGLVTGVRFLPGGRRALSAGTDTVLRLWDVETGKVIRRIPGHTGGVQALALSADGRRALSGGNDRVPRLWDVESGKELGPLGRHPNTVFAVALSPDGRRAATACVDDFVRLWALDGGKEPRLLAGHWFPVRALAFSPDGRRLLSADNGGKLILWDAATGQELHRLVTRSFSTGMAFFPDGRRVLCGGGFGRAGLYTFDEPTAQARDDAHLGHLSRAAGAYDRAVERAAVTPDVLLGAARFHARHGEVQSLMGQHEAAKASWAKARALFEKLLAARPAAEHAGEFADFLQATRTRWSLLDPSGIDTANGTTLARQPDGSVLALGRSPETETYTATATTTLERITAIRLEVLPEPRLARNGPGRAWDGNFILTRISVTAAAAAGAGKPVAIPVRAAAASFTQDGWDVRGALDDDDHTGWAITPRSGQAHAAYFALRPPAGLAGGTRLTIKLECHNPRWRSYTLGRFRLSVTGDEQPLRGQALLARPEVGGWTKLALAHYYRQEERPARAALAKARGEAAGVSGPAHFLLVVLEAQAGRAAEARKALDAGLAWIDAEGAGEGLQSLAVEALDAVLAHAPKDVGLRARRAHLLARLGRREEAAADYGRLAKDEPKNPRWPLRAAQLRPDVVALWNFDYDADGWRGGDCRLTHAAGRLRADGTGPAARIDAYLAAPAGWYELAVRARRKDALPTRVLWGHRSQANLLFADARCQWFVLPASGTRWAECKVYFVADEPFAGLRLEVGGAGDSLELDALTLRKVDGKGLGDKLVRQTTRAVELLPRGWPVRFARGDTYARLGRMAEAAADFAAAHGLDPAATARQHRDFATARAGGRNLPLAVAHLDALLEREKGQPGEAALRFWRGDLLGRMARWKEASADYARGLELDPRDHWHWFCSAALHLYTGDEKGYRADCKQMLQRFAKATDPALVERSAKACLLAPVPPEGTVVPLALTARVMTGAETHAYRYWFRLTRGMALCRAGEFEAALETLDKNRKAPLADVGDACLALTDLFMALCHAHRGAAGKAKARAALAEADRHMRRYFPKEGDDNADWIGWLHCRLARREVEALLKETK